MQYKNAIDIELVAAASEAYDSIMHMAEMFNMNGDYGMPKRLKDAIEKAKIELQMQEDLDNADYLASSPPTSMD